MDLGIELQTYIRASQQDINQFLDKEFLFASSKRKLCRPNHVTNRQGRGEILDRPTFLRKCFKTFKK